jgi:hypothetical protein
MLVAALAVLGAAGTAAAAGTGMVGGAGLVGSGTPTGIVDPSAKAVFSRTLRMGCHGNDVTTLQTWLSDVGYAVPVTGRFDAVTKLAVKASSWSAPGARQRTVGNRTSATLLAAVQNDQDDRRARLHGRAHRAGVPAQAPVARAAAKD